MRARADTLAYSQKHSHAHTHTRTGTYVRNQLEATRGHRNFFNIRRLQVQKARRLGSVRRTLSMLPWKMGKV